MSVDFKVFGYCDDRDVFIARGVADGIYETLKASFPDRAISVSFTTAKGMDVSSDAIMFSFDVAAVRFDEADDAANI